MWSVPVTNPCALNPTVIVQAFPDFRLPSQVFVWVKGEVVPIPVMLRSVLPKSVKVIGGVELHWQPQGGGKGGKWHLQEMDQLVVERVALGPVTTPIPCKAID